MSKSKLTGIHAARDHRQLRLRRVPLLLPARDPVRPGRVVLLGAHDRALHRRARQRARQPRLPGDRDGRPVLRRRAARRRPTSRSARRRPAQAAVATPRRRSTSSTCTARIVAAMDFVRAVNGYVTEQEPWKVAKDESTRAPASTTILYAAAEALRVVAVLLNPVMPEGVRAALWEPLGARGGARAARPTQRVAGRRRWGQLPAGRDRDQGRRRCSRGSRTRAGVTGASTAPGARRPARPPATASRCRCRSPTTTATSTSPTRPTTGCRSTTRCAAAAAVGVPRIVQIGCDLPGARWAVETAARHDALVAGVALHPNEAPRLAAAGALDERAGRDRRAGGRPRRTRRRGDRPRLLPHRTGRPRPTRRRRSARTSRWRSGTARRW